jgi:hypothetical protein
MKGICVQICNVINNQASNLAWPSTFVIHILPNSCDVTEYKINNIYNGVPKKSICFWNVSYPTITVEPYLSDFIWQFIRLHDKGHRQPLPSLHDKINNYFTFATSDNAIFHVKKYYCWNLLPTLLHVFARPTLANALCNLTHRSCHGSHAPAYLHAQIIYDETYLPGCLLTRLTLHESIHVTFVTWWPP